MRLNRYFAVSGIRVFGAPVEVHPLIALALVYFAFIAYLDPLLTTSYFIVYAGSIALHEYGHALMANRLGLGIHRIRLSLIHGSCEFEHPFNEWEHVLVAWGGVLAQFGIAITAWGLLASGVVSDDSLVGEALDFLVSFNLIVAAFNLLPLERLDGKLAWRVLPLLRKQWKARQDARAAIEKLRK